MRRFLPTILGALSVVQVHNALAQDIPSCVPTCSNQLRNEFGQFSCTSADDAACLCANANFSYGIRDCSSAGCGATDVEVYDYLSGNFCLSQSLAFTPTGTQPAATSTGLAPTTEAPAITTTPPPTSSVESPTDQQTTLETSLPTSTATEQTALETTSQTPTASPSAMTDSTPSESTPATTSGTQTTGATASETSSAGAAPAASGLSQAAVIGIGVGVGAGVIGIAVVAICLLLRNRKRMPRQSMEMSQSLPGSGRAYPPHDQGSFEKYSNDIEMVSNRYEDMVPRQKPRTMLSNNKAHH